MIWSALEKLHDDEEDHKYKLEKINNNERFLHWFSTM